MWKIIRGDVSYHRWLFICLYVFFIPFLLINALVREIDGTLLQIMFLTAPFIGIFVDSEEKKSQRIRFITRLPVPLRTYANSRHPMFVGFWSSLVLLYWLSCVWSPVPRSIPLAFWRPLTLMGLMYIIASCMAINRDIKFNPLLPACKAISRSAVVFFAVLAGVIYFGSTNYEQMSENLRTFWAIFFTPLAAAVSVALALGLIIYSSLVFQRRLTYLQ